MLTFDHFSVAVNDLDDAVEHWKARFGMTVQGERAHNSIGNFDFIRLGYGDQTMVHLIHPSSSDSQLDRLMQSRIVPGNDHGEGLYLMVFRTDDPSAMADGIESDGGRVARNPQGSNVWVHPTSSNFVMLELQGPPAGEPGTN